MRDDVKVLKDSVTPETRDNGEVNEIGVVGLAPWRSASTRQTWRREYVSRPPRLLASLDQYSVASVY